MKTTRGHEIAALGLVGAVLMAMAPAAIAASTWSISGSCTSGCTTATMTSETAFSTTGSGSTFVSAGLVSYGGGYGVTASGEVTTTPQHALDNSGSVDAILLGFNSSVVLKQLLIGWAAYDADVSVLRYTGSGAPVIAGKTISGTTGSLLSDGWVSVGNYEAFTGVVQADGGGNNAGVTAINAGGLGSSWWLISAYNVGYGGSNFGSIGVNPLDYVKLLSVSGDKFVVSQAPEPGTLALLAAALLGGVVTRGRKTRPAATSALAA